MKNVLDKIKSKPVIPVYYDDNKEKCVEILNACYQGGVRVFEFVNRGSQALENFQHLLDYKNNHFPDLYLGIGTIKTAQQAHDFLSLGAEFVVSPTINPEVALVCNNKEVFWIPGCMTPTEIALAESYNAKLIKLFPGNILGPSFLKSIKSLFPNLLFMPTGGVDVDKTNISSWFDGGVTSVGLGSSLFRDLPQNPSEHSREVAKRVQLLFSWINEIKK